MPALFYLKGDVADRAAIAWPEFFGSSPYRSPPPQSRLPCSTRNRATSSAISPRSLSKSPDIASLRRSNDWSVVAPLVRVGDGHFVARYRIGGL